MKHKHQEHFLAVLGPEKQHSSSNVDEFTSIKKPKKFEHKFPVFLHEMRRNPNGIKERAEEDP